MRSDHSTDHALAIKVLSRCESALPGRHFGTSSARSRRLPGKSGITSELRVSLFPHVDRPRPHDRLPLPRTGV
ncbi:hypothetical protein [Streptomyces sp. NPDC002276]